MTNGEKIKEIFPYGVLTSINNSYYWGDDILVSKDWWNAEYKESNSDIRLNRVKNELNRVKNELEPTTKNDLAHNLCNSCTNIGCEFQSGIVRTSCTFYMPPHIEPDNCGNYVVQGSTDKNNLAVDCISRQSVANYIDYIQNHGMGKRKSFDFIKKFVEELPSVTPIRPKGHWIENAEEYYKAVNEKGGGVNEGTDYFTDDIACSECLAKFSVIDNEAERFDFCPCCGSDNK